MDNDTLLLQKIYSHPEMRKIPVGYYSVVAHVIEDILKDIQKNNNFVKKGDANEQSGHST